MLGYRLLRSNIVKYGHIERPLHYSTVASSFHHHQSNNHSFVSPPQSTPKIASITTKSKQNNNNNNDNDANKIITQSKYKNPPDFAPSSIEPWASTYKNNKVAAYKELRILIDSKTKGLHFYLDVFEFTRKMADDQGEPMTLLLLNLLLEAATSLKGDKKFISAIIKEINIVSDEDFGSKTHEIMLSYYLERGSIAGISSQLRSIKKKNLEFSSQTMSHLVLRAYVALLSSDKPKAKQLSSEDLQEFLLEHFDSACQKSDRKKQRIMEIQQFSTMVDYWLQTMTPPELIKQIVKYVKHVPDYVGSSHFFGMLDTLMANDVNEFTLLEALATSNMLNVHNSTLMNRMLSFYQIRGKHNITDALLELVQHKTDASSTLALIVGALSSNNKQSALQWLQKFQDQSLSIPSSLFMDLLYFFRPSDSDVEAQLGYQEFVSHLVKYQFGGLKPEVVKQSDYTSDAIGDCTAIIAKLETADTKDLLQLITNQLVAADDMRFTKSLVDQLVYHYLKSGEYYMAMKWVAHSMREFKLPLSEVTLFHMVEYHRVANHLKLLRFWEQQLIYRNIATYSESKYLAGSTFYLPPGSVRDKQIADRLEHIVNLSNTGQMLEIIKLLGQQQQDNEEYALIFGWEFVLNTNIRRKLFNSALIEQYDQNDHDLKPIIEKLDSYTTEKLNNLKEHDKHSIILLSYRFWRLSGAGDADAIFSLFAKESDAIQRNKFYAFDIVSIVLYNLFHSQHLASRVQAANPAENQSPKALNLWIRLSKTLRTFQKIDRSHHPLSNPLIF
ncbi:hypothetical protein PPL_03114 [Heterostelium album PN500]|uniref:Uncharacterized protein n=1 Tax=Heterostelium pallidum (strain ATCC 26659 / Pp 5 / PN500) TaxID=670386 RepID=D3B3Z3_HETP5|nr:hypothetical protein PPL_03114 [Heterostelium album PN500]EFA84041.1 hypothetical protein PPL_03114 [Heterostelium album PN500]|eukprot:XP_020436158.1 hypothetical protein PPL_03114 [Heterostelium album PN500]